MQYALAFWQGNRFLQSGELGVANILTVVMATMVAGISIGKSAQHSAIEISPFKYASISTFA